LISIIDMGLGNLDSVRTGFQRVGAPTRVVESASDIESASAVVLPGVGSFGDGIAALKQMALIEPVRRHAIAENKPLLGICLGMQLLAASGDESGKQNGLGLIPGEVVRLNPVNPQECRVPNIGWCGVTFRTGAPPFPSTTQPEAFYFSHSYHFQCSSDTDVAATINYGGVPVTAAVQRGAIFGVQFHPEKSQDAGLDILHAFHQIVAAQGPAAKQPGHSQLPEEAGI